MGRRPKAAETTESTAGATEAPVEARVIRRRRRRSNVIDHVLVAALLQARGAAGAGLGDALAVVSWARGVHAEGAELRALATRVRKARAEGVAERQVSYEVNKALLEGVLAGTMSIDVGEGGSIVFGDTASA
jgi:hypothetical protein